MALAWTITDRDAMRIYNKMCSYFNSPNNLPENDGVFFGYGNFTKDKLIYCIEYMKKNYGRGWFTDDYEDRSDVIAQIANELYNIFGGTVDVGGIRKFLNWIYSFAKNNIDGVNYFQGGGYGFFQSAADTASSKIGEKVDEAVETVKYGVSYPSLSFENPLVKWGLILGGGLVFFNILKR